jgi:putative sterol carrier protein
MAGTNLTVVMELTGPGGGTWTVRVADDTCQISEGRLTSADLVMTQSPETLVKTMTGIQNPVLAMLTGNIKVRGLGSMGTFGKLFHPPTPNQILDYTPIPIAMLK